MVRIDIYKYVARDGAVATVTGRGGEGELVSGGCQKRLIDVGRTSQDSAGSMLQGYFLGFKSQLRRCETLNSFSAGSSIFSAGPEATQVQNG